MGWFSSKKKYVVNVTVQKIFEERLIPHSALQGIVKGITAEGDINEYIMEELSSSIGIKINTGLAWAKKNNYATGIPRAAVVSNITARDAVMRLIAVNEGGAISPRYYRFGPMNSLHYGWTWLVNTHQYNTLTNEIEALSATTGFKCYLKDMRATYTQESYDFMVQTFDMGVLEQLGPSPQSGWTPSKPYTALKPLGIGAYAPQPAYEVSATAVEDYVTVTYEFVDADGNFVERGLTVPIEGIAEQGDYHQVRYTRADGKDAFFTYLNGAGTYPALDAIYQLELGEGFGEYYPWIYFRIRDQIVSERFMPEIYKSCKGYAKFLGVNYDQMLEAVEADPDVAQVAQCILQLGVHPGDQHKACIEYLFKHFTLMHENSLSQIQIADNLNEKFQAFSTSPSQIQYISDNAFGQTLQYSGITKKRIPGSIGKVGTYTSTYGVVPITAQNFMKITPTGTAMAVQSNGQPAYIYRRQVLDSMYEEIAVYGLRIDYNVHYKKGFGAQGTDPELLIPVDRNIMRTISVPNREQLVCRAMHMLVNTVQVIKTEWYQSGIFKWVMIIVAVVITVFSAGTAWQTIVAAAAISTTALVITIISMILNAIIIQLAIKLFVKKFGPEIGFIAAVAAMAYGAYTGFGAPANSTWGESLIAIGNGLARQSTAAMGKMVEDIQDEIMEFQEYTSGQFDSLKEQRDQLGLNPQFQGLDGLDLIALVPDTIFGESPQDYYSRTVHSGNIGASSYELVEYYHTYALQLPKLTDVEGDFDNGELLPES
ncbi:hypothetical protein HWB52_gp14 [Pseudomonas phage Littlefix]|uniref:Uncharacterized protein n=1 Tax=Pseudomonas phage Littlefix TaxID=2079289 RepID=A0A2K9VHP3_9CAUD|nr:hypothetical protein HWB52_gp14 [Pseudomonas phage Littlefix]AUV61829.1 hypothetical protein PsPhLittlefix_gp14 [Pseudomonas phage Littlefix]